MLKTARADGDALSSSLAAEIDAHRSDLVEKEDAIAEAETELARLKGEISSAEARLETQDGKNPKEPRGDRAKPGGGAGR